MLVVEHSFNHMEKRKSENGKRKIGKTKPRRCYAESRLVIQWNIDKMLCACNHSIGIRMYYDILYQLCGCDAIYTNTHLNLFLLNYLVERCLWINWNFNSRTAELTQLGTFEAIFIVLVRCIWTDWWRMLEEQLNNGGCRIYIDVMKRIYIYTDGTHFIKCD